MSFFDYIKKEQPHISQAKERLRIEMAFNRNQKDVEMNICAIVTTIGHKDSHTIKSRTAETNPTSQIYTGNKEENLKLLQTQIYETLKDPDAFVYKGYSPDLHIKESQSASLTDREKLYGIGLRGTKNFKPIQISFFYSDKTNCMLILNSTNKDDWGTLIPLTRKDFEEKLKTAKTATKKADLSFECGLNNRPDHPKHGTLGINIINGFSYQLEATGASFGRIQNSQIYDPEKSGVKAFQMDTPPSKSETKEKPIQNDDLKRNDLF